MAAISFSGNYSQNFDSLASSGTGVAWSNGSTLAGWNLFRQPAPGTAIAAYSASDGGSNAGSFYSYGTGSSSDRALGGLGSGGTYFGSPGSGSVAGWIAFGATNATGADIGSITLAFDGEQWRNANTSAQTMALSYGFGASFDTVGSWTPATGMYIGAASRARSFTRHIPDIISKRRLRRGTLTRCENGNETR